ncbi:MAG: two-component system response regulator [Rhizobacter sp.]|nr:two-component system response regulator [Rhizobacter sp.]
MIVDDDESLRAAIGTLLRSVGYDSAGFDSGEAFLASRTVRKACALIVDVRLKGMSGFDVQRHVASLARPLPVIVISAYADEETRARALAAGATRFLPKPFEQEALLGALREALGERA